MAIPGLFFLYFFLFNAVDSYHCSILILPMTEFEPWTSIVGSNHSTSRATSTAPIFLYFNSPVSAEHVDTTKLLLQILLQFHPKFLIFLLVIHTKWIIWLNLPVNSKLALPYKKSYFLVLNNIMWWCTYLCT